jgi:tellurite methyltransferase
MNPNTVQKLVGNTDIYLLDQIIKDRYRRTDKILDAGCGAGRNLHWFLTEGIEIYGTDQNSVAIDELRNAHPLIAANRLHSCPVEKLPFKNNFFDHVISSAVLHFAESVSQFHAMMVEMLRVLNPGGSLFIRMTSDIGIEKKVKLLHDGVYLVPDGSTRFLLTRSLLTNILQQYPLSFAEPFKTVNVEDMRCMSTLVFQKNQ